MQYKELPDLESNTSRIVYKCSRCSLIWKPQSDNPARCPRCKNYFGKSINAQKLKKVTVDKYYIEI
jgi:rubrerythrin